MRSIISLIAVLAALASPTVVGASLTPHETEYKVRVSGVGGRLTTRLERQGDAFEATHILEPKGFASLFARGDVRERARFEDLGEGLQPLAYESRNTLREDSGAQLDFDWSAGRVTGMHYEEGTTREIDEALDASVFDRRKTTQTFPRQDADVRNGAPQACVEFAEDLRLLPGAE